MRYFMVMVVGMLFGMLMTASATVDKSTEEMLYECGLTVRACDDLWEDVLATPQCAEIVAPGAVQEG
jgi:hypothetical protein